ncbi:MAG: glycosyltransferase family 2 protein [Lachnospiraceae bacterium]|nr:glycosyltransferase family 2 protein [Lachnospiraceae bacterium]
MKDVLLIIPAYNEADSLADTVTQVLKYPEYDYVVIDDGSTDGTAEIIEQNGYNHLTHQKNSGLDATFLTGIRYAYREKYRYVVQIDADGQHDPKYIGRMVEKADDGYDVVIGSRYLKGQVQNADILRRSGSQLLRWAIYLTTGKNITDPTSGMRLYNRRAQRFFLTHNGCGPEPDTIAVLMRRGAKVTEAPVMMHDRLAGKSYLTPRNAINYMVRELSGIFFKK